MVIRLEKWLQAFPNLTAGFTLRTGGVSKEPFHTLNGALHIGDCVEDVMENRKKIALEAGIDIKNWINPAQVHKDQVEIVTSAQKGQGLSDYQTSVPDCDGLMTQEAGLLLTTFYADCVPLWFLDPVKKVIATVHAGWKGTLKEIGIRTIEKMQQHYQSCVEDIFVYLGPSIHSCCYVVGQEVIDPAIALIKKYQITDNDMILRFIEKEKAHINLPKLHEELLKKAGILPTNIEYSKLCTSCNSDLFFSHRRDQGKTGRMIAWIGWKTEEGQS